MIYLNFKCIDDFTYSVYISSYYYKFSKDTINKLIDDVLNKLRTKYDIDNYSSYIIDCFCDKYNGIVLLIKVKCNPFYFCSNKIDKKVSFYNLAFMYDCSDYFLKDIIKSKVYKYKDKYYLEVYSDNINIIEYVDDIKYGDFVKIIKNSKDWLIINFLV